MVNTMKKLSIILVAVLGIFAFSSCEDFLDMKPTNQLESSEAIKTAADAEVVMAGVMTRLSSSNLYGVNLFLYGDTKVSLKVPESSTSSMNAWGLMM